MGKQRQTCGFCRKGEAGYTGLGSVPLKNFIRFSGVRAVHHGLIPGRGCGSPGEEVDGALVGRLG